MRTAVVPVAMEPNGIGLLGLNGIGCLVRALHPSLSVVLVKLHVSASAPNVTTRAQRGGANIIS